MTAQKVLAITLLSFLGSFGTSTGRFTSHAGTEPAGPVGQYFCQFDCFDRSFLCCNSEGGCTACFDFAVVTGRKEIFVYGDPDFCESPPDSQGSWGVCPIEMSLCLALECLIEPPRR